MVAPTVNYLHQKGMIGEYSVLENTEIPASIQNTCEHMNTMRNIATNQNPWTCFNHGNHVERVVVQDEKLTAAALEAINNGNLTPLIKEELKCSIQSKRLAHGLNELKVEFTEPVKHELSAEEKMKVERRREQNMRAARRFRERQRSLGHTFQKETQKLESDNTRLNYEIRQLRILKDKLQKELNEHLAVCPFQILFAADPCTSIT